MDKKNCFPTPVYSDYVTVNDDRLLDFIFKIKEKDPTGMVKSNMGNSYHSADNLHTLPEFHEITEGIAKVVQKIFEEQKIKGSFFIGNMWANINYKGGFNDVHTHGNSYLSGVYYIKVPKDSGVLRFIDPRPQSNLIIPQKFEDNNQDYWNRLEFNGERGQVLIFPAYLPHQVLINNTDEERVSISFNIILGT